MREQSFMKSLFFGIIDEALVFPWPEPASAEVDALHALLGATRKVLQTAVDPPTIDRDGRIPAEALRALREAGLFGLAVPARHGGAGMSATASARVIQELGGFDASVAATVAAHQSLGTQAVLEFGTNELRELYLPRLARGEWLAAFALAEAGAGSDAAGIQTRADPADGGYVLRGEKVWVTNGGVADLFVVFARTSPPDDGAKPKITAFLVERAWGVRTGGNEDKLGLRGASTPRANFDGVRVPASHVLGEPGRGFKVATEVLDVGRLSLASAAVGTCRRALKLAVDRCASRRAFGRTIGEFGFVKDKIAQMAADTWALESMTYLTTGLVDAGLADFSVESAICKVFGSEVCWRVVQQAQEIAGGAGFMAELPFERLLRDARANLFFEGTNETLRAFIALSGMQGPGRHLADVARAMREPIKGFGLLSEVAIRRAKNVLVRERLTRHSAALAREAVVFEQYVQALAGGADRVLRRHGRDIAEMQFTQKRTADLAIELYAIAACVVRATRAIEKRGEEGARREIDLTSIFVSAAERRLEQIVKAVDTNDDELRKDVASRMYADGGYPLDVV